MQRTVRGWQARRGGGEAWYPAWRVICHSQGYAKVLGPFRLLSPEPAEQEVWLQDDMHDAPTTIRALKRM